MNIFYKTTMISRGMFIISICLLTLFSCQKITHQAVIKDELLSAYNILKGKIPLEQFNKINWAKGQNNTFSKIDGTQYHVYLVELNTPGQFLVYGDSKGHEAIKFVEFDKILPAEPKKRRVIIRDLIGNLENEMIVVDGKWINQKTSFSNSFTSTSAITSKDIANEPLPEVLVIGYIPSSNAKLDFWNLFFMLQDKAYYNDFLTFQNPETTSYGGGGDNSTPNESTGNDPCGSMKTISADTNFVANMQDLSKKVNQKNEEGYVITKNASGDFEYSPVKGNDNENFIKFNFNTRTLGIIHSHYSGLNSMPSPGDLKQLGAIFVANSTKDRNVISSDFTLGVVSTYGSYVFKINNIEKFVNFYVDKLLYITDYSSFSEKYKSDYNLDKSDHSKSWETNFLKLIKDYDTGLTMFKGSNDSKSWQEKTLNENGNSVIDGPCKN